MKPPTDWSAIRLEYITKRTPYRELARKYGVNVKTLGRKAKAEGWVQMSTGFADEVSTKVHNETLDTAAAFCKRLYDCAGKVLDKVDQLLELEDALAPRDVQSISSTLINLKDLRGIDEAGDAGGNYVEVVFVDMTEEAAE